MAIRDSDNGVQDGKEGAGAVGEDGGCVEVRKEYKQTDIGILPTDWKYVNIGNMVLKVGSGITPTGGSNVYVSEGRPFLRSQNVGWGTLLLDDIAYISDETHSTFPATEIMDGDVFLNITGASIGRSAKAMGKVVGGNVNQHVCIVRPIHTKLDQTLLCYLLLSRIGQTQIANFQAGGNRQGLNFGQIKSIQLPLPPTLTEQTAIATALSDTDALIRSLEKLIAKKRAIKQGTMQELLTGKRRLPGFEGKWEVISLSEVANPNISWSLVGGPFGSNLKASDYASEGVRIIQLQNIGDGIFYDDYKIYTTKEKTNELLSCNIYPGEIILSKMDDPVARACFVPEKDLRYLMCSDGIRLAVDESRFAKKFVHDYINSIYFRKNAIEASTGSTRQRIAISDLKKLPFIAPSLEEQTAIASILSDMDSELTTLERKLSKLRSIKQGMMQELLTGKTRLV